MAFNKKAKKGKIIKRRCSLCDSNIEYVDYKNIDFINKFLSGTGQIKPHSATGSCARHQRKIANAVKRARFMALIPYTKDRIRVIAASQEKAKKEPAQPQQPESK
ncbi:30S ribosomal protein S18 [Mycoplasmopsis primatum]|uniref:30S ribosomal protein S18 n=1 Tax=Mycoplasmopsis primatum TaxID=55604 RepID=UPI000494EF37|nr:30S ribosomal protein S18 [Mycoplasmopsis primatum]